jgi:outer membrane receptor for ferrienterochelin and colicin
LTKNKTESVAGYVQGLWKPFESWQIVPALRVEYDDLAGAWVDPRLMARIELAKNMPGLKSLALKGGVGLFHQPPSLLEIDPRIGNPGLATESATQWMGGIDYRPMATLAISVQGFYVSENNMFVAAAGTVSRNGVNLPENISNDGNGQTYGLEVFIQEELYKGLEGWLSYTLSRSEMSTDSSVSPISQYDQTHVLALTLAYALPKGFKISGRFQYATGNPTTGVTGSVFDATTNTYSATQTNVLGARLPAYQELDLRIDKAFDFRAWRLTVYLDVRNVSNALNLAEPYNYNYNYTLSQAPVALPILPLLGLRADF